MGAEENKLISGVVSPCLVAAGGAHSPDPVGRCWLHGAEQPFQPSHALLPLSGLAVCPMGT